MQSASLCVKVFPATLVLILALLTLFLDGVFGRRERRLLIWRLFFGELTKLEGRRLLLCSHAGLEGVVFLAALAASRQEVGTVASGASVTCTAGHGHVEGKE